MDCAAPGRVRLMTYELWGLGRVKWLRRSLDGTRLLGRFLKRRECRQGRCVCTRDHCNQQSSLHDTRKWPSPLKVVGRQRNATAIGTARSLGSDRPGLVRPLQLCRKHVVGSVAIPRRLRRFWCVLDGPSVLRCCAHSLSHGAHARTRSGEISAQRDQLFPRADLGALRAFSRRNTRNLGGLLRICAFWPGHIVASACCHCAGKPRSSLPLVGAEGLLCTLDPAYGCGGWGALHDLSAWRRVLAPGAGWTVRRGGDCAHGGEQSGSQPLAHTPDHKKGRFWRDLGTGGRRGPPSVREMGGTHQHTLVGHWQHRALAAAFLWRSSISGGAESPHKSPPAYSSCYWRLVVVADSCIRSCQER